MTTPRRPPLRPNSAASSQGVVDEAAKVVPAGESPSISDRPSTAALPLAATGHDPDQEHVSDDLTAAAAPVAAPSDRASDAAGEYAPLHGDRVVGWAIVEQVVTPKPRRIARAPLFALAAIGLVSLPVLAGSWLLSSTAPPAPHASLALASTAADRLKTQVPSIAVLPFITRSEDAKLDYLADGITDSLISDLVRAMPGISVVSRGTAFTYKGRAVDARQIGRELGVRYLLKGSIAFEGERVRVNTELAETTEGNQLWAERFDTERKGILQVQDEIVARVSRAIGLKVVDIEARRSWRERPSSAELIDLIMRGKAVLNLPSSPATMMEARGLFEQALAVEPTSVDGLTGVATTLVFEFLNGYYETGNDERLRKAELLLDQAGAIEPAHLMTLKAKAALRRAQGKFDDAIAVAQTVIMENPGEPWAYKEIGLSNIYLGRPEQALDWFAKAARIGPRDPARWTWLGRSRPRSHSARTGRGGHPLVDQRPRRQSKKPLIPRFPGRDLRAPGSPRRGASRARRLPAKISRHEDIHIPSPFAGSLRTDEPEVPAAARTDQRGPAQGGHARIAARRAAETTALPQDISASRTLPTHSHACQTSVAVSSPSAHQARGRQYEHEDARGRRASRDRRRSPRERRASSSRSGQAL